MKRSRKVGLLAASASILLLAACYEDEVSVSQDVSMTADGNKVYASLEACTSDLAKPAPGSSPAVQEAYDAGRLKCLSDWETAKAEHEKTAPRFASLQECEAQFGAGACGAAPQSGASAGAGSGGGSFMPFLMGYMIGNALSPSPAYNSGGGWSRTPPTRSTLRSSGSYRSGATPYGGGISGTPSATVATTKKTTLSPSTRSRSSGFGSSFSSGRSSFGG